MASRKVDVVFSSQGIPQVNAQMQTVARTAQSLNGPLNAAGQAATGLGNSLTQTGRASAQAASQTGSSLSMITSQLQLLVTNGQTTNTTLGRINSSLGATGTAAARAGTSMRAANNNTSLLNGAFGSLSATTTQLASQLGNFNGILGSLAFAGASAGVVAFIGALTYATTQASNYNDSLVKISTLVDEATFNMKELNAGLKEQAVLFGQDASAQAGAAYDIISSGADNASDAITTLNSANTLAVAGATTVGVAADGLTSVLNAFAGQALTATQAADSLFTTYNFGKISTEQLASQIGDVAPIAATLGLSLDEVGASIGAMTLGGMKGSVAITNLKSALTAVVKPSSEASKLAEKIGLDFSSSALKAKGWAAFLDDIKVKTKGSQDQMAVLLGGTEALSAVLSLTGTGAKDFAKILDAMANKSGIAAAALKKVQDASASFQAGRAFNAFKVEIIGAGESIATALVPALRAFADNAGTIVTLIETALIPVTTRLVILWGTTAVQAITTLAATAAMRFASMAAAQGVFAASTATLTAGLSGMVGLFGGPWGLALAGASAGLYALYDSASSSRAMIDDLAGSAGQAAATTEQTGLQSLMAARGVESFGGQAGKAAGQLWQMANAARSAAIETARVNYVTALGKRDEARELTAKGYQRAQARDFAAAGDTDAGWGDRLKASGRQIARAVNYAMAPSESRVQQGVRAAQARVDSSGKVLDDLLDSKPEAYLPKKTPTSPGMPDMSKDKPDKKAPRDKAADFIQGLKDELATSERIGIEAQKYSKEREYAKALGHELNTVEKSTVDTLVQQIANAKAISGLKQRSAELQAESATASERTLGLTAKQAAVEDEVLKYRQQARIAGADVSSDAYKAAEAQLRKDAEINQAIVERSTLIERAAAAAKNYGAAFAAKTEVTALDEQRKAIEEAFATGKFVDEFGNRVSQSVYEGILSGLERARVEAANKPLKLIADYTGQGSTASVTYDKIIEDAKYKDAKAQAATIEGITPETRAAIEKDIEKAHVDALAKASYEASQKFVDDFTKGIDQLADMFGGTFGKILKGFSDLMKRLQENANPNGGLAGLFSMFSNKLGEGFKEATGKMTLTPENLKAGFDSLGSPLKDLKAGFDPQAGGSFLKGIGKAVGGAMQGYEIGSQVGQLMTAIGIKHGETGAKIGGAIGGLTGNPLIAMGASAIGGIIGSLLYKPKYATASLTGMDPATITGNKSDLKTAAGTAAGSVQSGLQEVADRLGATVGSFSVAIGQWEGKWRVNDNATSSKLHYNNFTDATLHNFGDDAAAAVQYAIENAIKDGAIQGLGTTASNALKSMSVDAAISFIDAMNKTFDELDQYLDPIGASARAVNKPLDDLIKQMNKVGSTSEELGKVEQLRSLKLKDVLKQQLSTVTDLITMLKGEETGTTVVDRFNADYAKFKDFQTQINAGSSNVDQGEFAALVNRLKDENKEINGTATGTSQGFYAEFLSAAEKLSQNITTTFNEAAGLNADGTPKIVDTTAAIDAQTDALTGYLAVSNEYQRQQVELLKQMVAQQGLFPGFGAFIAGGGGAINGGYYPNSS